MVRQAGPAERVGVSRALRRARCGESRLLRLTGGGGAQRMASRATMELPAFNEVQAAVAEQRAGLEVDRLAARWLVVQGRTPIAAYIGSGGRWFFCAPRGADARGRVAGGGAA